jgi:hypothetical protein
MNKLLALLLFQYILLNYGYCANPFIQTCCEDVSIKKRVREFSVSGNSCSSEPSSSAKHKEIASQAVEGVDSFFTPVEAERIEKPSYTDLDFFFDKHDEIRLERGQHSPETSKIIKQNLAANFTSTYVKKRGIAPWTLREAKEMIGLLKKSYIQFSTQTQNDHTLIHAHFPTFYNANRGLVLRIMRSLKLGETYTSGKGLELLNFEDATLHMKHIMFMHMNKVMSKTAFISYSSTFNTIMIDAETNEIFCRLTGIVSDMINNFANHYRCHILESLQLWNNDQSSTEQHRHLILFAASKMLLNLPIP